MTTTTTKFVDQFSRMNNSSNDDTLRATRKCMYDDFYTTFETTAPRRHYGNGSKLRCVSQPDPAC